MTTSSLSCRTISSWWGTPTTNGTARHGHCPTSVRISYAVEDTGADILILGVDHGVSTRSNVARSSLACATAFVDQRSSSITAATWSRLLGADHAGSGGTQHHGLAHGHRGGALECRTFAGGNTRRDTRQRPESDQSRGNVVALQPWDHPQFYNAPAVIDLANHIEKRLSRVGRGRELANFDAYRSLLSSLLDLLQSLLRRPRAAADGGSADVWLGHRHHRPAR